MWTDIMCFTIAGRVVDGLLVLRKIENVPTGPNNKPKIPVMVKQFGEMWILVELPEPFPNNSTADYFL